MSTRIGPRPEKLVGKCGAAVRGRIDRLVVSLGIFALVTLLMDGRSVGLNPNKRE
jgi:hypothetical protein